MSDLPERRRNDVDLRERIARIEPVMQSNTAEVGRLRERVHDQAQHIQMVVSATEEANEKLGEMGRQIGALGNKFDGAVLAYARVEVSLSATMTAHIEQCNTRNSEQKDQITRLGADRERMHEDNQKRFAKIERVVYLATGALAVLSLLAPHAGEILKALK